MNTRLHTLLRYVGLQDRLIAPEDLNGKIHCAHIDVDLYALKAKQNKSIAFLKSALGLL